MADEPRSHGSGDGEGQAKHAACERDELVWREKDYGVQEGLDAACDTLGDFLDSASVDRVYGEPVAHGETLVIPAAEVVAVLGFGVSSSRRRAPATRGNVDEAAVFESPEAGVADGEGETEAEAASLRASGGGGGGQTFARPVALVVVSPTGVRVRPVVDSTKIVLASLATGAFIAAMVARILSPRGRS